MARTQPLVTAASRWFAHLWHEWTVESWGPIAPAPVKPRPNEWPNDRLTAAWLGHATVLLNYFGITILTDPVLLRRIGIPLPFTAIGPKRLTAPVTESSGALMPASLGSSLLGPASRRIHAPEASP